jgi:hypothetical protein
MIASNGHRLCTGIQPRAVPYVYSPVPLDFARHVKAHQK